MKAKIKKSQTSKLFQPKSKFVSKSPTYTVMKKSIDNQISMIKKYSKWMILMQLPMVEPCLGKYCNFDYNAYLIKEKIKDHVKSLSNRTQTDRPIHIHHCKTLKQIPDHWKSSPYKMNIPDQILEGRVLERYTFDQHCKFFGFSIPEVYINLPQSLQTTLIRNIKMFVLDSSTIVPYHFFRPSVKYSHQQDIRSNAVLNDLELIDRVNIVVVFLDSLSCMTKFTSGLFSFLETKKDSRMEDSFFFMMNYPGQPFTSYGTSKPDSNLHVAGLYEKILCKLLHEFNVDFESVELEIVSLGSGSLNSISFSKRVINNSQPIWGVWARPNKEVHIF